MRMRFVDEILKADDGASIYGIEKRDNEKVVVVVIIDF